MAGGFFGGLAEGLDSAKARQLQQQQIDQTGQFQQGMLQIHQQQLKNEQQRLLFERADKDVSNIMSTVTQTVQSLRAAGKDNFTIAKLVQPIVDKAKRLKMSSGGNQDSVAALDAQLAATLAQPSANEILNPGSGAAQPAGSARATTAPGGPSRSSPSDIPSQPSGTGPQPQGQNLTDQKIVGVEPQQNEIDRWTSTLARIPNDPKYQGAREAAKARLQSAIALNTPDATVHFVKDTESGTEIPVIVTKQGGKVSITDTKGNPYVPPTGRGGAGEIADAIMSGKQPPSTTGLYKQGAAVRAHLAEKSFDLTNADLEWKAAQKQVQSLNGPQMIRYAGLAKSVVNTVDEVRNLSQEMQNSGVPALNALKLQSYIQTEGNSEKGQLASRYLAAVNTLKEEFANLAQGGYAPTEAAWALANQQINGNYGVKQLDASLTEVQRLIRYRLQGIPNFQTLGPNAPNRYKPDGGGSSSATPSDNGAPQGGTVHKNYTDYFK